MIPNKVRFLLPREQIEPQAMNQIANIAALDFVELMAIMPDVHTGYDMPIGGVALTRGVIVPAWVGFDIGCGMCFVDTHCSCAELDLEIEETRCVLHRKIHEAVPVGFASHQSSEGNGIREFKSAIPDHGLAKELSCRVNAKAGLQFGTLGGGNHFIEIGVNSTGHVGIVIHSGSRNPGHSICEYYSKHFPKFLPVDSPEGQAYIQDMTWAQDYALANRRAMMHTVLVVLGLDELVGEVRIHNENHNHAQILDGGMVLHRKGATPADKDQVGMIPGNMRDGTYITRGLGNSEYLSSASHGAGRVKSRKKAAQDIPLEDYLKTMKGIISDACAANLDESPFAYKNINQVIERQAGIVVEVIDHFKPIINVKG